MGVGGGGLGARAGKGQWADTAGPGPEGGGAAPNGALPEWHRPPPLPYPVTGKRPASLRGRTLPAPLKRARLAALAPGSPLLLRPPWPARRLLRPAMDAGVSFSSVKMELDRAPMAG